MKKRLLCAVACVSLLLVACSSTKPNGTEKKDSNKTDPATYSEYVTLGKYKGMEVEKEVGKVEDSDVQKRIQQICQENSSEEEINEGTVKKGDTVNIDYIGKIDGVPFDGGKAKGQKLGIGSNQYIPGFETGLIGAKVGSTVTIHVTFPKDYGKEELNGKEATFDVTINYIVGKQKIPEWTDSFVKNISEYDTTKEYEEQIRIDLEKEVDQTEEYVLDGKILKKLVEVSKFKDLPKDLLKSRMESLTDYYKDVAKQRFSNLEFSDFLQQQLGMTEEQFNEEVKKSSEESVKQTLATYAVAEAEDLIPEGSKMKQKKEELVKEQGYKSLDEFVKVYGDDYASQLVVRDVVLQYIKDNAKITEVPYVAPSAGTEQIAPEE